MEVKAHAIMRRSIFLCLIYILALLEATKAQQPVTGLILDDEAYDTIARLPAYDGSKELRLPKQVDLSPYCPEVRHQGDIYSCVGWAVGYAALTIRRAIREKWTDRATITANAYSALFIYNQIREGHCRQGSRLSKAMELLKERGDCPANVFDFDIENCERLPGPSVLQLARRDTISDYLALFGSDEAPEARIWKVKRALAQKEPVIIGMAIRQNFLHLRNARYWWPKLGNTTSAGGHALTVVGYDDESRSFLLFNSWGTEWGDRGYIRMKYDDFAEHCKYAYMLIGETAGTVEPSATVSVNVQQQALHKLAGGGQLRYLDGFDAGQAMFKAAGLQGRSGEYRTTRSWPLGQLFQLAAHTRQQNLYLYVFTVDPAGQVNIHWPRQEALNPAFAGQHHSALVVEADSRVTIPGPAKALRAGSAGTDIMYMLFSTRRIRGLSFITSKMSEVTQEPMAALRRVMGSHLVPAADIQYRSDEVAFTAATRSGGYIVPVVLITQTTQKGQ